MSTEMRVLYERPPFYEQLHEKFGVKGTGAIFTFGNVIYAPGGGKITRELFAHEEIHCEQQGLSWDGIESWWHRYMDDPAFRLSQEIPAHRAEYLAYVKRHASGRERFLIHVAGRLCGPLYGNLLSLDKAIEEIMEREQG